MAEKIGATLSYITSAIVMLWIFYPEIYYPVKKRAVQVIEIIEHNGKKAIVQVDHVIEQKHKEIK